MKLTCILLMCCFLQASAGVFGQHVSLSFKNASIQQIFKSIKKQTGFTFLADSDLLKKANKVTVDVENVLLEEALKICFHNQPFGYSISGNIISVKNIIPEFKTGNVMPEVDVENPPVNISGRVVDENGNPVIGASVFVKGSKRGVSTNINGEFKITNIDDNAVLVISAINIQPYELSIANNPGLKSGADGTGLFPIIVKFVIKEEEQIVVAYGRTTQKATTGSISVVKGEQIQSLPNRSLDKSLQGLVPGLLVTSGSGQPGSSTSNFVLRGIATGGNPQRGETFRNPLIVIDGMPVSQEAARPTSTINELASPESNPMAHLNPSDVESISVLKDAAAVALYGSRASNGVILITTKRGKAGKAVFNIRSQTDFSSRLKGKIEALNQDEYLELLYEAYRNSRPGITDVEILSDLVSSSPAKFPGIVDPTGDTSFYPAANWEGELYKSPAVTTTNEVSMSGGNDKTNFYLNLEYTKQNGVVQNTGYDRKSVRFNYEYRPAEWFKLNMNTTMSYNVQDYNSENSYSRIMAISPLNPIMLNDGTYLYNYLYGLSTSNTTPISNPVASAKMNVSRNTAYRGLNRFSAEFRFLKHFAFSSLLGVDYMSNEAKRKISPKFALDDGQEGLGKIGEINTRTSNIITTNILRFNTSMNSNHIVDVLAGQEAQILSRKELTLDFIDISENPDQDQLYGKTINIASGNYFKQTLLSYFGQINYNFKGKYFATGSIRTDGSSQFGKNERFGSYWSTGLGWVVTEEMFMKQTARYLNYLKLRTSFGPSGNSAAISDSYRFDYYSIIHNNNNIAILPDIISPWPGNPGIQWEQTFTWDVGVESRFANNRITVSADYYNRKTNNLIATNILLPISTGFNNYVDNIGDIKNTGIELSVVADIIKQKSFKWQFSANWSRNRNKLVKSYYPRYSFGNNVVNEVGREFSSFFMPVWAGVNEQNGHPLWVDSTGKTTENYDDAPFAFVGKTQPDGFGSINNTFGYKGLELGVMLYYQYGFQIFEKSLSLQNDGLFPYLNQSKDALNRWQKPGDQAKNPRRLLNARDENGQRADGTAASTRYLSDGDFIRLANIKLSYGFPRNLINRIFLTNLRVFIQGSNLATWTKYNGQDPENVNSNGEGGVSYPQQKVISIGINASF